MGLVVLREFRDLRLGDFSGQQHAAGFSADGAAADHPAAERKIVLRQEILSHQVLQTLILGHGAADDMLLGFRREVSPIVFQLRQIEEAVIAVEILVLASGGGFMEGLVVPAHAHAVRHRSKLSRTFPVAMGQEHLVGVSVPHLQWMEVDILFIGIHIQQQLGSVPNAGHRVKGVPPPKQGEIGHRVQLEQVWAGHPEEVAHHHIRIPNALQLGKAVEYVKSVPALAGDLLVDGHGEGLESRVRIKPAHLDAAQVPQHRIVLGKADVDDVSALRHRLSGKGLREHAELLQFRDLPHHIIPQADKIQNII